MRRESLHARAPRVHEGERDDRGSGGVGGIKEQWILVDKIVQCSTPSRRALVWLGGKALVWESESLAEILDLLLFCFEIVVLPVPDDEIELDETCLDEFGRMPAVVTDVRLPDSTVERL